MDLTSPKNVFMTGASGFLGRNLLKRLLEDYPNDRFFLLVRSNATEDFLRKQLSGVIDPNRIVYVRGDVRQSHLGMNESDLRALLRQVQDIWHLAASTNFDEGRDAEIRETNLGGTRNVIEAITDIPLDRFFYVSTAYICGTTTGVIPEDELPPRNGFRNIYEETKYDAEQLVRASGLPFTILRPSILLGNSRTGDSDGEVRMMYGYVLGLYQAAIHSSRIRGQANFSHYWRSMQGKERSEYFDIECRLVGWPHTTKNILAIDDCVEMISRILTTEVHHKTFNLVNSDYINGQQIVDTIAGSLRIRGLVVVGHLTKEDLTCIIHERVTSPLLQCEECLFQC